jgi:hypothetical protein
MDRFQRPPAPPPLTEIEARATAPADPEVIQLMPARRAATTTSLSSPKFTSFTTAAPSPSSRADPVFVRTSSRPPWIPAFEKPEPSQPGGVRFASAAHLTHGKSTSAS